MIAPKPGLTGELCKPINNQNQSLLNWRKEGGRKEVSQNELPLTWITAKIQYLEVLTFSNLMIWLWYTYIYKSYTPWGLQFVTPNKFRIKYISIVTSSFNECIIYHKLFYPVLLRDRVGKRQETSISETAGTTALDTPKG